MYFCIMKVIFEVNVESLRLFCASRYPRGALVKGVRWHADVATPVAEPVADEEVLAYRASQPSLVQREEQRDIALAVRIFRLFKQKSGADLLREQAWLVQVDGEHRDISFPLPKYTDADLKPSTNPDSAADLRHVF
jgi:hypothetical protein